MLCAVYGWLSIDKSTDPFVNRINQLMHRLVQAALPGSFLVELFPSMLYLPDWMARWKREGRAWFMKDTKMFEDLLADVQNKMVSKHRAVKSFEIKTLHPSARGHRGALLRSYVIGRREKIRPQQAGSGMAGRNDVVSRHQYISPLHIDDS